MGVVDKQRYTDAHNDTADWAKALAHPARIAILTYMMKSQACICGDLVDELGLAQSTISQHLTVLKQAGLIQGEITGTRVCYCINGVVWNRAFSNLVAFFEGYKGVDTSCCE